MSQLATWRTVKAPVGHSAELAPHDLAGVPLPHPPPAGQRGDQQQPPAGWNAVQRHVGGEFADTDTDQVQLPGVANALIVEEL